MKNIAKTIIAFLIMGLVLFIGIIAVIFGIKEQKEKARFSKDISWKNEKQSEAVCKNEKIVQKNIRYLKTLYKIMTNNNIFHLTRDAIKCQKCWTLPYLK